MEIYTHDEIAQLTRPQKLELIERLWDSLDERHVKLTKAQEEEIDRRLAAIDAGETDLIPWETVREELRQRYMR